MTLPIAVKFHPGDIPIAGKRVSSDFLIDIVTPVAPFWKSSRQLQDCQRKIRVKEKMRNPWETTTQILTKFILENIEGCLDTFSRINASNEDNLHGR
jgi:hypothetical protein